MKKTKNISVQKSAPPAGMVGIMLILIMGLVSSCKLNPSVMFKVEDSGTIGMDSTLKTTEYRIRSGDLIEIDIYTNKGISMIEENNAILTYNSGTMAKAPPVKPSYLVQPDGLVKLPIVGKINIKDLTIQEAEKSIEDSYREFYKDPFVIARVINRRVMVFPGTGGTGRVVELNNEDMSLVEVLTLAGGLTERGKAKNIKIIRGNHKNPTVIKVDLSTVDSFSKSDIRIQADDIIYVEPVPRISQEVLTQLAPIVGIITSLALIYQIAYNNTK